MARWVTDLLVDSGPHVGQTVNDNFINVPRSIFTAIQLVLLGNIACMYFTLPEQVEIFNDLCK